MSDQKKGASGVLKNAWKHYNYIIIFAVLFVLYLIINGDATNWVSVTNILYHSSILGTIALGMGIVILTGEFDLSVGSLFVLVGGMGVLAFNATGSIIVSLVVCVVAGAGCGLANGVLIAKCKISSFIVTLATMLIFRSVSQYWMDSIGMTRFSIDGTLPSYKALFEFGNGKFLTIPFISILWIAIAILLIYVTKSTKYGKRVYALGSNEKAARLAGINVIMERMKVFMLCGCMCGLAAFLKICKDTSFDPATSGKSFELYAIASVVIGGILMSGGVGSLTGVIFGTMSFTVIDKIINVLGMNALLNDTIKGVILLIAVGAQMVRKKD